MAYGPVAFRRAIGQNRAVSVPTKKLTKQEKQVVRFMFFLAVLGLFFSMLLPYIT